MSVKERVYSYLDKWKFPLFEKYCKEQGLSKSTVIRLLINKELVRWQKQNKKK